MEEPFINNAEEHGYEIVSDPDIFYRIARSRLDAELPLVAQRQANVIGFRRQGSMFQYWIEVDTDEGRKVVEF